MAPRKVRLVVDLVRDKDVDTALDQLAHLSNRASRYVSRTIESAIANAENNHRMVRSNLFVAEAWVDEGLKLRRWIPKGFGRAGTIQKKTSRINVVLDERVAGVRQAEEQSKPAADASSKPDEAPADTDSGAEQTEAQPERKVPTAKLKDDTKPAKGLRGFGKKLFRRKSI